MDMFCVGLLLAELILRKPLLRSNSTIDMIITMIEILGMPTDEEIGLISSKPEMIKDCIQNVIGSEPKKRQIASLFSYLDSNELDLLENLLQFNPNNRMTVSQALLHPYFDEFRDWDITPVYKLNDTIFSDFTILKSMKTEEIIGNTKREMKLLARTRKRNTKLDQFARKLQQTRLAKRLCDLTIVLNFQ
ncbi:predicted protein [Naegleria gruberi]|uniref:Predicted protein n=1 Tax=Naegleria gruberi TaxID=5762 RepID=D2VPG2_NAEGR|nr:uncharacterized protein NAEGRDRAFT_70849 [Naegleria gruberi]EFC41425.1 predicted protein [Naegleria gruberi]|eukprot:XP_002674169.1 predicted protein [Naegleria gruberi strain NEG-M]